MRAAQPRVHNAALGAHEQEGGKHKLQNTHHGWRLTTQPHSVNHRSSEDRTPTHQESDDALSLLELSEEEEDEGISKSTLLLDLSCDAITPTAGQLRAKATILEVTADVVSVPLNE